MGRPALNPLSGKSHAALLFLLILFFLVSAPPLLFATSPAAGVRCELVDRPSDRVRAVDKESVTASGSTACDDRREGREEGGRRVLKVRADDYASYDPTPTFVKPPYKDILN